MRNYYWLNTYIYWKRKKFLTHFSSVERREVFSSGLHSSSLKQKQQKNWDSVVGLEIHAQLKTSSKLFSGSAVKFAFPANTLVSFFDCATPGTLPTLNKNSVEAALLTALALNCKINNISEFDRKHYFYADMPAGYQITQQRLPLAVNGYLSFGVYSPAVHKAPYKKKSNIKQLQLEQDSGKSLHEDSNAGSLIDLNRAGVGLMEIVFEPDLKDGEEAVALVSELVRILEILDTCNCKMEEGSLRVDANVSVMRPGEELGTRTEIKNLNSLRSIARSIDYEISRQIQILERGGQVTNETRGYDAQLKKTLSMRDKEEKQDYRYMPESNLLSLNLHHLNMIPSDYQIRIPVLPEAKRSLLMNKYQMSLETAMQIVNGGYVNYFEAIINAKPNLPVKKVCSFFLTDLLGMLHKDGKTIEESPVTPEQFAELVELLSSRRITHSACQNILSLLYCGDVRSPKQIVDEERWEMITDSEKLESICLQIISSNAKSVAAFKSGKTKVFSSLGAQLKKACNDRYDMGEATATLRKLLESN